MRWFSALRRPKQVPEYDFEKIISYRDYNIHVYAKERLDNTYLKHLVFNVGFFIENVKRGYYNSGISAECLQNHLSDMIIEGKKFVDAEIKFNEDVLLSKEIFKSMHAA